MIVTYFAGSNRPLTTFLPVENPTGALATPSRNTVADPKDASSQDSPNGYNPAHISFEAAIGVFCSPDCRGESDCLAVTGQKLTSNMIDIKATLLYSDA